VPTKSKNNPIVTPHNADEIGKESPKPQTETTQQTHGKRKGPSDTAPDAWTLLLVEHWKAVSSCVVEHRAGARGVFLPVPEAETVIADPRGSHTEAAAVAQSLWRRAVSHCEEEGGPIDYRLSAHAVNGDVLGRTTRASRIDVTSPDGRPRELADDDRGALLKSAIALVESQTRTVSARDRGIEAVVQACGQALAASATALAQVTSAVAALEGAASSRVTAEGEVWLAKAEFVAQSEERKDERESNDEAAAHRRERLFDWLDQHGEPIAAALAEIVSRIGQQMKASTPSSPAEPSHVPPSV